MTKEPQLQAAERSAALRQELKQWEKAFAAANNGRKASRDDIKKDRVIASKYKEYNRLRDQISGKVEPLPESAPPSPSKRRKVRHQADAQTPLRKVPSTPSRGLHPADLDPYDSPFSIRKLAFQKEPVSFIGPTPQKNGIMLGLFDLLEEEVANSPSKKQMGSALHGVSSNVFMTPRKGGTGVHSTPLARTPVSSSRRRLFDAFTTPLKNKSGDLNRSGSSSRSHFSTPAFLRRDKQGGPPIMSIGEDGEPTFASPVIRMPPKPLFKGLSSLIADMRKIEEEALDEEIDILNGLETGTCEGQGKPSKVTKETASKVLVKDSQSVFDDEGFFKEGDARETDEESEDERPQLGRDGQPLRVWKKKGQKRTTKKHTIRPSRVKPKSMTEGVVYESDGTIRPEEQSVTAGSPPKRSRDEVEEENQGSDVEGSNFEADGQDETPKKRLKVGHASSSKPDEKISQTSKSTLPEKGGLIKKAVKKVSSQANANFRRLKLRSKNSKGARGNAGRYGRKR